tara:strand:- start:192 stop:380 length:189 start_codon:yes stop_codon:yes gene_type:complete
LIDLDKIGDINSEIDKYVKRVLNGERLIDDHNLQFYENYKKEIEDELFRVFKLKKSLPIQKY